MNINFIGLLSLIYLLSASFCFAAEKSSVTEEIIDRIQQQMRTDLSKGLTEKAQGDLEKALGNFHSVEVELGLIQTLMQAGNYRHALIAAAHTQAEHPETTDATLFYAWLLAIGGQLNPAAQLIEKNLNPYPDNETLKQLLKQIKDRHLNQAEIKTSENIQLGSFIIKNRSLNSIAHNLATGIIIDNGKRVIAWLNTENQKRNLLIRNGLGQESPATIEKIIPNTQIAVLKLAKKIKTSSTIKIANKTPFPGTPIYVIGYTPINQHQVDWPHLNLSILGTPTDEDINYPIHLKNTETGSAVFNQEGNLIGLLTDNIPRKMIPIADILAEYKTAEASNFAKPKPPLDELYETALSNTVQVLYVD
jgi:tetratricopeptide (TPR) repeat protein